MKKSKAARGLVTNIIQYQDSRYPHQPLQTLTVDVRQGENIEDQQAAAMVAVRAGVPLAQVKIMKVTLKT
jgi:hypothetical protein